MNLFKGNMKIFGIILLLAVFSKAQQDLECPFPGGQADSSESECARYSACQWSEAACSMRPNGDIGYTVSSEQQATPTGFTVTLDRISQDKTLFDGDISQLVLEVINHEDYHVQIKITDASSSRYEVPVPLDLPSSSGTDPLYSVDVASVGSPFQATVTRLTNGANVFSTYGALTYEDQFIQFTTVLPSSYLYGFGENTHEVLRHQFTPRNTWPIFARDQPIGSGFMNEYGHHPYYSVVEDDQGNTHSVLFFNSNAMEYSTFITDAGEPALTLRTIGGIVDLHFFLGPTPEDVNMQYIKTIGLPVHPPYWFFGFQLSRWGYTSPDHVREVVERTKAAGIPQDVQTFDIDYMERYRDFTYDTTGWADLPQLIDELHSENIKIVLILDVGIVIDWDNYPAGERGRAMDVYLKWMSPNYIPGDQPPGCADYMVGYVWPDTKTVFPDFFKNSTFDWWKGEIELMYQDLQFDGIWIDMNEPANFGTDTEKPWNWPDGMAPWSLKCPYDHLDSPPYPTMMVQVGGTESHRISDHSLCMSGLQTDDVNTYVTYDVHSLYGWSQSRATYNSLTSIFPNKRAVVMSRSTFPGSGTYAVHWLGDNSADWLQMRMSIVGMIEFNMFGIPMVGADICGFFNEPDVEMCARWQQLGAFYPFSRNHNADSNADQDPGLDPTVAAITREALLLRYKYLPYLYTLFQAAHTQGRSVVRPLYNEFPSDLTARDVDDQFLWGSGLMVAPVVYQGAVDRGVYFPQALWYDISTGELISSSATTLNVAAPLDTLPVYLRGGMVFPTQTPALSTAQSRLNPFGLTIVLDESGTASGSLFWDDGETNYDDTNSYSALFAYDQGVLSSEISYGASTVTGLFFDSFTFFGVTTAPTSVEVNGDSVAFTHDAALSVLTVISVHAPLDAPLTVALL